MSDLCFSLKRKKNTYILIETFSSAFSTLTGCGWKVTLNSPEFSTSLSSFRFAVCVCVRACVHASCPFNMETFFCCLLKPQVSMPEKGKVKCKRARAQDLSVYLPFPEPKADRTRSTWLFIISETPEICFFFFFWIFVVLRNMKATAEVS